MGTVGGSQNGVAVFLQEHLGKFAQRLGVFYQQDRFCPSGVHRCNSYRRDRVGDRLFKPRQVNRERRAFPFFRIHRDVASALLYDAVNGGQTEAGPLIALLGGEEGLEYLRLNLWVYARSGVGDSEHHVGTRSIDWVTVSVGGIEFPFGSLVEEFA